MAVRFPVEIVAQWPEEIVEIGDAVSQFGDVVDHLVGFVHHAAGGVGHFGHERLHSRHRVDGALNFLGLEEEIVHAVLQVALLQRLQTALHAQLRGQSAEF